MSCLGDEMATVAPRFVIYNGMTHDLAQVLLADLRAVPAGLSR